MNQLLQLPDAAVSAQAWQRLLLEAREVTDYRHLVRLCRERKHLLEQGQRPPSPDRVRVALLSGATIDLLEQPLELCLHAAGIDAVMHSSQYNSFAPEILNPHSETIHFAPDVAVLVVTAANIPAWPRWNASEAEVDDVVANVCEYWLDLCQKLHQQAGCEVVLPNFHALPTRPLGSAAARFPGDANRFLARLNDALARYAPTYVHLHDVASLAAFHGISQWFDQRFWHHAKQPVSFQCFVPYVRSIAQLIAALRGRSAKCVIVDLDNTMWGGIVGDDGPDRVVIGEGDPEGEAFASFQRYLLQLKERGVLLAVCSKNEEGNALAPFETRPEMVLKRADFVAFHANWRPKSDNVREIAAELNVGLDSIVFVDDNPVERDEVRRALPAIKVVELGSDPSDYATLLDQTGWLDTVAVSTEDVARSRMYQENTARLAARLQTTDYQDYLRSLDQRATIGPFEEAQLDRITQLTNKTNQFNLTTLRQTRAAVEKTMRSPECLTACVRLRDRFGDNGLISVFAARGSGPDLWIELWLMSCRVLNRGVEQLLCNYVVAHARDQGYTKLHGLYIPTAKNVIVKDHYAAMGFYADGMINNAYHWILDPQTYEPVVTCITAGDE